MSYNKYLEDLGVPRRKYDYEEWTKEDDPRNKRFAEQKEKYSFDSRECWSLDGAFAVYLYSRVKMYKEDASAIVDLSFCKVEFEGKVYSQEEAIDFILEKCEHYLKDDSLVCEMQQAIRLFAEIYPAMWW